MNSKLIAASLLALAVASANVLAAGSSSSATKTKQPSQYDQAVRAVDAGAYERALQMLDSVIKAEPRNADAWNYIGFSHRNLKQYDKALAAYNKALAINPKHRGAREYLGELYLMTGDVAKAEAQLRELDSICYFGCEEYDELKAAIAKHKRG